MKNSYRLQEWLDTNGNKVSLAPKNNTPTVSASKTSTLSYRVKFSLILSYHMANTAKAPLTVSAGITEVKNQKIKDLYENSSNAGFRYEETCVYDDYEEYIDEVGVVYFKDLDEWEVIFYRNNQKYDMQTGEEFNELLKALEEYLILPDSNSAEYKRLLESLNKSFAGDFQTYETLWD